MTTAINPYPDDIAPPADGRQTTENSSDLVRCDNCGRHGWHTSDRCPDELIDVPLPTGANPSEWWDVEDGEPTFRCVEGTPHLIGKSRTRIYTHCTQWEDGSVEDGKTEPGFHGRPGVALELLDEDGHPVDTGITFTSAEAREAAAVLIAAADEVDGWVAK